MKAGKKRQEGHSRERERDWESDFGELASAVVGTGTSTLCRAGGQVETQGRSGPPARD